VSDPILAQGLLVMGSFILVLILLLGVQAIVPVIRDRLAMRELRRALRAAQARRDEFPPTVSDPAREYPR
jgi:hypothetical protein